MTAQYVGTLCMTLMRVFLKIIILTDVAGRNFIHH